MLPGSGARGRRATADALARALARQQLLLVLDNCEQVIGAVAVLCAALLPGCDDVQIMATSREPLRVAGEARYWMPLFADRGRLADASFTLMRRPGRWWRGWWRGWMGCRWRLNWPRRGQ